MNNIEHDKFQESLLILILLNKDIYTLGELFDDADKLLTENNNDINYNRYFAFYSLIIIKTISFIDEYEILRGISKEKTEFVMIDKQIKPLRRRIEKWTDLRKLRNSFLAHTFRDPKNDNKLVLLEDYVSSFNVPISHYDVLLLVKITNMMLNVLGKYFNDEMTISVIGLSSPKHENETIRAEMYNKSVKTKDEYLVEVENLEKEIENI